MADVDKTAYNIVPPNSFAYNPARINVGSIGYYAGTENVIVSSLYVVFQTADYVEDGFLWHWFKSTHFPKWIERLQEGSVRLYFYYDKLIQCEMKMPSLEEQKKIGKYFDNLDHLITLHQRKCDELQKLKKFMLQNMFTNIGNGKSHLFYYMDFIKKDKYPTGHRHEIRYKKRSFLRRMLQHIKRCCEKMSKINVSIQKKLL